MEIGFGITCMVEFTEFDVTYERSYIKKKRERLKMDPEDNQHFKRRRRERIPQGIYEEKNREVRKIHERKVLLRLLLERIPIRRSVLTSSNRDQKGED